MATISLWGILLLVKKDLELADAPIKTRYWEGLGAGGDGDEMAGWHHRLNGRESE